MREEEEGAWTVPPVFIERVRRRGRRSRHCCGPKRTSVAVDRDSRRRRKANRDEERGDREVSQDEQEWRGLSSPSGKGEADGS